MLDCLILCHPAELHCTHGDDDRMGVLGCDANSTHMMQLLVRIAEVAVATIPGI